MKFLKTILRKAPSSDDEKSSMQSNMQDALEGEKPFDQSFGRNLNSKLSAKKKAERKKNIKRALYGLGALLLVYGISWLFKPFEGGMSFGVCKVFLEQQVQYPNSIQYRSVEDNNTNVRIWFTHLDGFGEYKLEALRCYYGPDAENMPGRGFVMTRATLNRREIDPNVVARFNPSIPTIRAYPPDLVYPPLLPDSLSDIKFQTERYRRQLF